MCLLSTFPVTCPGVFTASDNTAKQKHSPVPVILAETWCNLQRLFSMPSKTSTVGPSPMKRTLFVIHTVHLDWRVPPWFFPPVIRPLETSGSACLIGSVCSSFQITEHLRRTSSVKFSNRWCRHDLDSCPFSEGQSSRWVATLTHECLLRGLVLSWRKIRRY